MPVSGDGLISLSRLPWARHAGAVSSDDGATEKRVKMRYPCGRAPSRRVGSSSMNAEAYEITTGVRGMPACLKLMHPGEDADEEVRVATYLSDLVRKGKVGRIFPLVYGHGECSFRLRSGIFKNDVLEESRRAALLRLLSEQTGRSPRRVAEDRGYESVSSLRRRVKDERAAAAAMREGTVRLPVLVSEMMYCDMNYIVTYRAEKHPREFRRLIRDILDILLVMFRLRVWHGDAHFGNWLVRVKADGERSVSSHDFGTTKIGWTKPEGYLQDLTTVLDCVRRSGVFRQEAERAIRACSGVRDMKGVEKAIRQARKIMSGN